MYWPGINKDIENLVKTPVIACQENARRNTKDPVITKRGTTMSPWSHARNGSYLHVGGSFTFLLVVDVTCMFPCSVDT